MGSKAMGNYIFTMHTKGQLILKCLVRFLGELKTPKRHFEIDWPLGNLEIKLPM